jgi:hypothetical protein
MPFLGHSAGGHPGQAAEQAAHHARPAASSFPPGLRMPGSAMVRRPESPGLGSPPGERPGGARRPLPPAAGPCTALGQRHLQRSQPAAALQPGLRAAAGLCRCAGSAG